jgi:hypothetical protein
MALTAQEGGDLEDGGNLVIISEGGSSAETVTGAVGTNDDKSKNQQLNAPTTTCPKEPWECFSAAIALYHGHTARRTGTTNIAFLIHNTSDESNAKKGEEGGIPVVSKATEPVRANGVSIAEQLSFVVFTVFVLACTFCFLNFGPTANGIWATIAMAIIYGMYVLASCKHTWMT